jgi:hypothetical protein
MCTDTNGIELLVAAALLHVPGSSPAEIGVPCCILHHIVFMCYSWSFVVANLTTLLGSGKVEPSRAAETARADMLELRPTFVPNPILCRSIMPESRTTEDRRRRDRKRSRSPHRESHSERRHKSSRRSRSPRRDDDRHGRKKHRSRSPVAAPATLPYKAKPLSKHNFDEYRPLFQSYLDIQKQIQLDDLDEREARGRWKSFVSRWYVHCLL